MERWYKDRIGGMFIANAEALADLALRQPSVGMAEVGFRCVDRVDGYARSMNASIWQGEDSLRGWAKVDEQQMMAQQVYIGALATMLGSPSAPYVYVRGIDMVFSPECIDKPYALGNHDRYRRLSAAALGAGGQFRVWLNDTDGLHNAACNKAGRFYLFDHDANPHWDNFIAPKNETFIKDGLNAACELDGEGEVEYMNAATEMAQRISSVQPRQLELLADKVSKAIRLPIEPSWVSALADRIELMNGPQLPLECRPLNRHACPPMRLRA